MTFWFKKQRAMWMNVFMRKVLNLVLIRPGKVWLLPLYIYSKWLLPIYKAWYTEVTGKKSELLDVDEFVKAKFPEWGRK